ncbi:serine/threonine-protein kinase [Nocardioides sambongensis]|uniref:serine/threonine-protein kinase n=1 Tax=Nocardioides sambongensis TaxID=2589074 RepID=UPI00112A7B1C|nr:serine/threonine-protein kinase [Nocardioides sambongensis]
MSSPPALGYPTPGARIGRFRILEQLGQGGMGVVFRALEENLGREVALKVIAPHYAHDPEFRERFTREARAQASLESSHVVAVYAHGEEDGYLYIASQLIVDGDLGELIRTAGVPPMVNALEVIEQVASGLADAHDAGLVHRDIKPGNVLVRIRGGQVRAYLCDFGIARRMNAAATRFSSSAVGTPSYMAPELHAGASAGPAADIYSLGCLLWVALTGESPFRGTTEYQVIGAHINDPVPQLADGSAMAQATNRILRTAMAKEPADRYASAAAMRADLQAALRMPAGAGQAVPAPPAPTALRPVTPTGRPATANPAARPFAPPGSGSLPGSGAPPGPPPPYQAGNGSYGGSGAPTEGGGWQPSRRRSGRRWWVVGGVAAGTAIAVGIAAAVLTAGSGGEEDDPSGTDSAFAEGEPKEIVNAAEKEMAVLEVARVEGQFQSGTDGLIDVDLISTSSGDCEGTMTLPSGGSAEFRSVDNQVYLRPDEAYWQAIAPDTYQVVTEAIGDRWVEGNDMRSALRPVCDLDRFFERDGREDAVAQTEGVEEVSGKDAVKVTQSEGSQSETLYVQVEEPHYLLRLEESGVDVFEFSDFDMDVEITAPTTKEIFDLDKWIQQQGG